MAVVIAGILGSAAGKAAGLAAASKSSTAIAAGTALNAFVVPLPVRILSSVAVHAIAILATTLISIHNVKKLNKAIKEEPEVKIIDEVQFTPDETPWMSLFAWAMPLTLILSACSVGSWKALQQRKGRLEKEGVDEKANLSSSVEAALRLQTERMVAQLELVKADLEAVKGDKVGTASRERDACHKIYEY